MADRLKELKVKLEDSEAQLVAYAQKEKIVNVDEKKSLVSADLETLSGQISEASQAQTQGRAAC